MIAEIKDNEMQAIHTVKETNVMALKLESVTGNFLFFVEQGAFKCCGPMMN